MGPRIFTMLLLLLCILLIVSNFVSLRALKEANVLLARYDALAEQYGGLEMVLSQLTKKQVAALIASSALGLNVLTGCESEPQSTSEVRSGVPIVYDKTVSEEEPSAELNAAAASMLLGFNGVEVAEDELYLGLCLASSADEVADGLNQYLPLNMTAVCIRDISLLYLPGPCITWIDGKPVVFVYADEAQVKAWEVENAGLEEPTRYGFSEFERKYNANGQTAVYLIPRGYEPIT